ncbi:MAG: hypothetical protein ACMVY4_16320 [Minwuia sp.]|uniref:hypothetical protein n=1 Tax=Minwuia sp. TaxID=2493630 RepID=UPI003A892923
MTLFEADKPDIETAQLYADDVCETAGSNSNACYFARQQANTRCYRTLGVVDCYLSDQPFSTTGIPRSNVQPIDKRPRFTAVEAVRTSAPVERETAAKEEGAETEATDTGPVTPAPTGS